MKKGMTLVEVLIALAMFSVVMIAIGTFEINIFSYNRSISSSYNTTQNAQLILKTILKELRELAPSANGSYPLAVVGSTTISFFADSNSDGINEKITYSLIGNSLYRAVIQPIGSPANYSYANQSTSTILYDIRNGNSIPVFQYFNTDYNGTSSPLTLPAQVTDIRLIKINVALNTDMNKIPTTVIYTVQVNLRNIKDNL